MIAKISGFDPSGQITAPPSKSFAHRLLIAAALGDGEVKIENIGSSDDIKATLSCLAAIGAGVRKEGDNALIEGLFSKNCKINEQAVLNLGESGSTYRFLLPVVCALGINAKFIGDGRLMQRPMGALKDLLAGKGIVFGYNECRGKIESGVYEIDGSVSSQFVTGLLFALPLTGGDCEIVLKGEKVSGDYIEMTLAVMKEAGIEVERKGDNRFIIRGGAKYRLPKVVRVEGDWSGAAFPLVLGVAAGKISVEGLNAKSLQGDRRISDIIISAGGRITEKGGNYTAEKSELKGFKAEAENCPDLVPALCVLAAAGKGESEISGVKRLVYKESDRLESVKKMLFAMGAEFSATEDIIKIKGGIIKSGAFDGCADHRIVMACAIAAAMGDGLSTVSCAEAAAKSYPAFFDDLKKTGGEKYVCLEG